VATYIHGAAVEKLFLFSHFVDIGTFANEFLTFVSQKNRSSEDRRPAEKRNSSNFTHWLKKLLSTSYECLALLHSATEELVVYFEGCVATFATISMIRLLKNFATKLLVILLNVDEY
jgi:hypothetical protein